MLPEGVGFFVAPHLNNTLFGMESGRFEPTNDVSDTTVVTHSTKASSIDVMKFGCAVDRVRFEHLLPFCGNFFLFDKPMHVATKR
jgi:hypothetical protein